MRLWLLIGGLASLAGLAFVVAMCRTSARADAAMTGAHREQTEQGGPRELTVRQVIDRANTARTTPPANHYIDLDDAEVDRLIHELETLMGRPHDDGSTT